MKYKQQRILRFFLMILLLLIFIFQLSYAKELISENKLLQSRIKKQNQKNQTLKNEYLNNEAHKNEQKIETKNHTAEVLAEIEAYSLKLIDFSSNQNELNLNIYGDFHSILNFIQYLEVEMRGLKIEELKIKKNNNQLFFFIKLKNELI